MLFDDIENEFERIETIFQNEEMPNSSTKGICDRLKFLRKQCNKKLTSNENALLLYCIDTMLEIINKDKTQKIVDFANISKQVVEVYQKKRYFHSLSLDITNFRFKWGKDYFKDYKKIYRISIEKDPAFMTKDEKEQYIRKTKRIIPISIISWFLSAIIYNFVVIKNAPNEWYTLSGFFGIMFLQFGVLNFFADKQIAMSKKTSFCLIAFGGIIFLLSMFFLFT